MFVIGYLYVYFVAHSRCAVVSLWQLATIILVPQTLQNPRILIQTTIQVILQLFTLSKQVEKVIISRRCATQLKGESVCMACAKKKQNPLHYILESGRRRGGWAVGVEKFARY